MQFTINFLTTAHTDFADLTKPYTYYYSYFSMHSVPVGCVEKIIAKNGKISRLTGLHHKKQSYLLFYRLFVPIS